MTAASINTVLDLDRAPDLGKSSVYLSLLPACLSVFSLKAASLSLYHKQWDLRTQQDRYGAIYRANHIVAREVTFPSSRGKTKQAFAIHHEPAWNKPSPIWRDTTALQLNEAPVLLKTPLGKLRHIEEPLNLQKQEDNDDEVLWEPLAVPERMVRGTWERRR